MILYKKQLFDLEVKGQGPTKVIMVRDTPPCGHAPTYQISLTCRDKNVMARTRKYYLKNNYLILRSKIKAPMKVITVRDTPPYGHAHTNYLPMKFCWIYLNYLTLRSKVKVPQRSLWYATHHLMVMHPHTNYH